MNVLCSSVYCVLQPQLLPYQNSSPECKGPNASRLLWKTEIQGTRNLRHLPKYMEANDKVTHCAMKQCNEPVMTLLINLKSVCRKLKLPMDKKNKSGHADE